MSKKIEKIKIPRTKHMMGLRDENGVEIELKELGRKVNEVIDYLNQDQKQPEGYDTREILLNGTKPLDIKREGVEYEKRIKVLGELSGNKKHIEAHKEFLKLPEAKEDKTSEDWRERLVGVSYMYDGELDEDGNAKSVRAISFEYKKLIDFIESEKQKSYEKGIERTLSAIAFELRCRNSWLYGDVIELIGHIRDLAKSDEKIEDLISNKKKNE